MKFAVLSLLATVALGATLAADLSAGAATDLSAGALAEADAEGDLQIREHRPAIVLNTSSTLVTPAG